MKLIKINTDNFIIVDASIQPVTGYYYDELTNSIENTSGAEYGVSKHTSQITHSNVPMEGVVPLDISEVKELLGVADVEKKAEKFIGCKYDDIEDSIDQIGYDSFIRAYKQALEDNKDKKYTEEDVIRIVEKSRETGLTAEYLLLSIQPKTEWEVEFIDGKIKLI